MIGEAKIAGELQQVAVQRLSEMIETNQQEAVSIIRNWIGEAA